MSLEARGFAVQNAQSQLAPFSFTRRDLGPNDVLIAIDYCGVCHSDIHQVRNEWGGSAYPMVPGHEIVGRITRVGSGVTQFKVGDLAGVGCFVDSCRTCQNCDKGIEQYCDGHLTVTYNGVEKDLKTPTYGGYSSHIVVDQKYTLRVPTNLPLDAVAPLLCAGITTYSPLRHAGVSKGHRVGVFGLGGLGHMAVKFAASFGAEVTVLSSSPSKEKDAKKLGAHHFALMKDESQRERLKNSFDFIVDTVSAPHEPAMILDLLRTDGTLIIVGVPEKPLPLPIFPLIMKRRKILGSLIGGIRETQEMLDYCGTHKIVSDVEVIPIQKINEAYERMLRADVRYRFVIDMKTL